MACQRSSNECLLAAATALALQISQTHNAEELGLLSAFFVVLGDQLAMLALGKADSVCSIQNGSDCL